MTHPNTTLIPFSDEWEQYMLTRAIEEVVALLKQCGNENFRLVAKASACETDEPGSTIKSNPNTAQLVAFGELVLKMAQKEWCISDYGVRNLKPHLQQMANEFKGGKG